MMRTVGRCSVPMVITTQLCGVSVAMVQLVLSNTNQRWPRWRSYSTSRHRESTAGCRQGLQRQNRQKVSKFVVTL